VGELDAKIGAPEYVMYKKGVNETDPLCEMLTLSLLESVLDSVLLKVA
jgi:hypothetical protein